MAWPTSRTVTSAASGAEQEQRHNLEVDPPPRARRRGLDAIDVAGRRADLAAADSSRSLCERLPICRAVTQTNRDQVHGGKFLHGDTQSRGQTLQKRRRQVQVLLTLVGDVLLGRHRDDRIHILREPHDRGNPHRERRTRRRLGGDHGATGQSSVLELAHRVGVKVDVATYMKVTLRCRDLIDRRVERVRRVRQLPSYHQRPIDPAIQRSICRANRVEAPLIVTNAIRSEEQIRRAEIRDDLRKVHHSPLRAKRGQRVTRRAGRNRRREHIAEQETTVVGLAESNEPWHRSVSTPRPSERCQGDTTTNPDEHNHRHDDAPLRPQFRSPPQPHDAHRSPPWRVRSSLIHPHRQPTRQGWPPTPFLVVLAADPIDDEVATSQPRMPKSRRRRGSSSDGCAFYAGVASTRWAGCSG